MLEYWSINDIKNKILPKIKVGEYYVCDDRIYENQYTVFTITEITDEHYGWRILRTLNKNTGKIKHSNGTEFGSTGRINKKSFHRQVKNGTYKKMKGVTYHDLR